MIKQKVYPFIALFVFCFSIWYVFYDLSPEYNTDYNKKIEFFSTDRAYNHVKAISKKQHYVGTIAHSQVRNYIVEELEKLNLIVHTQQDYCLSAHGDFSIPENIITKIEGKNPNAKALLLMTHYDSSPHSSYGAAAASGVAVILEAIRAFLSSGVIPQQDIIICIADAKQLGFLGTQLFIDKHPWAKHIGLVLNFDSRGNGGPSYTFENGIHGNSKIISEFSKAKIPNPLGTSLTYDIFHNLHKYNYYEVFSSIDDIPSINFAFIDNHFDYQTALDIANRMNLNSISHQGDYAYHLINHFSQISLDEGLYSKDDMVYFNLPYLGVLYYPASLSWLLFSISLLLFLFILFKGVKKQVFARKEISLGFLGFSVSLVLCFLVGFIGWKAVLTAYPGYLEVQQEFPYNGHDYIFAFVCFCISINFLIYRILNRKLNPHNALVAPLSVWIIVCCIIAIYFPRGSYFSIVLLFGVLSFAYAAFRTVPNFFIIWFLSLPLIGLILPFIQFFPVGFGMSKLGCSTLLTSLVFGLMLGFLGYLPFKRYLAVFFLCIGIAFIINAHVNSRFDKDHPLPNSLVYVQDLDAKVAYFGSYDNRLDDWNKNYFKALISDEKITLQSNHSSLFTYTSEAPIINLKTSNYKVDIDSLQNGFALVKLSIKPRKTAERIELFTPKTYNFESFKVNNQEADTLFLKQEEYHNFYKRHSDKLLTYHVVNNEELILDFKAKLPLPEMEMVEISFNLLNNKALSIPKRPKHMIPKPFVVNDAIILKKKIEF